MSIPKISEGSYVSVGVLIALMGALFWVGAQGGQVERNRQDIVELKSDQKSRDERDILMLQRLSTIETLLTKARK